LDERIKRPKELRDQVVPFLSLSCPLGNHLHNDEDEDEDDDHRAGKVLIGAHSSCHPYCRDIGRGERDEKERGERRGRGEA
jgi:hypothetical protein